MPHVLLLGGHGKVAQLLTPLLLRRAWTVTSVVRRADQTAAIEALAPAGRAHLLRVLVHSLEDAVQTADQARALLARVRPDYVVFAAGAGGRGGAARTQAVDRDAAVALIDAAAAAATADDDDYPGPPVSRFLLVSYVSCRRAAPPWTADPAAWHAAAAANHQEGGGGLAPYFAAKIAADEALYRAGRRRNSRSGGPPFAAVDLRPGALTDGPAGPVELGRVAAPRGPTSRAAVARVADLLLAHPDTRSAWIDLLDGLEDPEAAVDRVVRDRVDAVEGEPVTREGDDGGT